MGFPKPNLLNTTEWVSLFVGFILVALIGPPVGAVVGSCVLWEACDRGFAGGFVESGQELSGFIFARLIPLIERITTPYALPIIIKMHLPRSPHSHKKKTFSCSQRRLNKRLVKHEDDAFLVNATIWFCLGLPLLLTTFGYYHLQATSLTAQLTLCWLYHVIRMGPMFMNFAYVYSLCHKEGHAAAAGHGLWRPPFDRHGPFRYLFNWWVGLYYGVLPATFAIGHSINHHKYNNGPADVVSTADKPRDEWLNLIAYVPRFALYACNISTTWQFIKERKYGVALNTALGSAYYFAWCYLVGKYYGGFFAFAYLVYPFLEQTLMLSGINWVWHAFLDPNDVENEYVQSITILGGTINVLNEDSHVVHHQYPGFHWSKHPKLLTKHADEYKSSLGSVFYGTHTFEVLALILMADYEKLADRFVGYMPDNAESELFGSTKEFMLNKQKANDAIKKPKCPLPHAEVVELLKERLRACWWGPRAAHVPPELLQGTAGTSFARMKEWEMVDDVDVDAPAAEPAPEKGAKLKTR